MTGEAPVGRNAAVCASKESPESRSSTDYSTEVERSARDALQHAARVDNVELVLIGVSANVSPNS